MDLFDIRGKRAIVTGGTRGLGWGMAEGLLEAGAEAVIFGTTHRAETVAEQFRKRGFRCHGLAVDLADPVARTAGFCKAVELLGGLDILVNAAGIQKRHPCENFPLEDWDAVINVNLTAAFALSQLAAREFLRKEKPAGKIINVASMLSFFGGMTVPAYAASKGGIYSLTHALALSLAEWHITVNSISPGWICTGDYEQLRPEDHAQHPSGRVGKPEDIARMCLFICQEENDFMNGENVTIDGGMTKKMIYIE